MWGGWDGKENSRGRGRGLERDGETRGEGGVDSGAGAVESERTPVLRSHTVPFFDASTLCPFFPCPLRPTGIFDVCCSAASRKF